MFGVIVDTSNYGAKPLPSNCYSYTFAGIQRWIYDNHKIRVSKSSISSVKTKRGIDKIGYKAGKVPEGNVIRSKAEKLVLKAFKALEII